MSDASMRIVVSGRLAGVPHQGGASWAILQYVLGLRRLGHDVHLVEPIPRAALPASGPYFREVVSELGLDDRSTMLVQGTDETVGTPYARLLALAEESDLLLNLSGLLRDESILERISRRVYVDLDPVFTQLWHEEGIDVGLGTHTHFVTVGHALTGADWRLPTAGVHWAPTTPPVVLEHWPVARRLRYPALTTVANWRSYGSVDYGGASFGQKAHSLRRHLSLPRSAEARFLLALAIDSAEERDLSALEEHGWQCVDPGEVAGTPARYREFVQGSWAEFGLAKSGYVDSGCGWFSDRSACYLASGRPVVAQDTGFGRYLPLGEGLFSFRSDEDVVAAVDELRRDYGRHAAAARALAEEHLDSDKVLGALLDRLGAAT